MIQIHEHFSLKEFNTFGISAFAKAYTAASTLQQLKESLGYFHGQQPFLLGGGSNILILEDIQRPVIHMALQGISTKASGNGKVLVKAGAGVNWHTLVEYCIDRKLGGLENLSLIPGNVGTAPIQNIGAYGVELKDVMVSCDAIDRETLEEREFTRHECKFGYRNSIFKNEARDKYAITAVTLELTDLSKTNDYRFNTSYGAIEEELERLGKEKSLQSISEAVINIRTSKLPDPKVIGNSGSFFKNPVIEQAVYDNLKMEYPALPSYPVDEEHVKVPAGYLIDHCGFKGQRTGDAGVHDRQALVLVNHGKATGKEILEVARAIQQKVRTTFGIKLEPEVNLIG